MPFSNVTLVRMLDSGKNKNDAFALQQILIVPLQDLIGDMEDFVNVSFGIVGQSEKMFQWNRLSGCRCGSAADLC